MILLKTLISEELVGEKLSAGDVYNFYYLWYISNTVPKAVSTDYGREVMKTYIRALKDKYVRLFKDILVKQLIKYIKRKRVDSDLFLYPINISSNQISTSELKKLMNKTFRSDMKNRNDQWNMVADFVDKLNSSTMTADMFIYINQLNNAVHNTGTTIMRKFYNFNNELRPAFDMVDKIRSDNHWELLKKLVSNKDIRDLLDQDELV